LRVLVFVDPKYLSSILFWMRLRVRTRTAFDPDQLPKHIEGCDEHTFPRKGLRGGMEYLENLRFRRSAPKVDKWLQKRSQIPQNDPCDTPTKSLAWLSDAHGGGPPTR